MKASTKKNTYLTYDIEGETWRVITNYCQGLDWSFTVEKKIPTKTQPSRFKLVDGNDDMHSEDACLNMAEATITMMTGLKV